MNLQADQGRKTLKARIKILLPITAGVLLAASTAWACTLVMVSPVVITDPTPPVGKAFPVVDPGDTITVSATGLNPLQTYTMRFGQPCQSTPNDPENTTCTVSNTYAGGHGCMSGPDIGSVSPYTPTAASILNATGTIPATASTSAGLAQICFAPADNLAGSGSAYVYVTS